MKIRALLFDFDGVLADTENVHIAAWERAFARMGWDVSPEVCAKAAEQDDREFLREILLSRGVADGDIEGWTRYKQGQTLEMLRDVPRLYPGASRLVRRLSGEFPLAVVSGTWRSNVETVLESAGLVEHFRVVVAKEDVGRPKPDASAYRLAAERLGIPPGECFALEDSPTGLAAARAAGVSVAAVGHRRAAGAWSEGASFIPDLRDTEAVLRLMGL